MCHYVAAQPASVPEGCRGAGFDAAVIDQGKMAFCLLNSMALQGCQLQTGFCIEVGLLHSTRWVAATVGSATARGVP